MKRLFGISAMLMLTGCATTPTAPPAQGMFVGETPQEVMGKLVGICMDREFHVQESSSSHVLCQREATTSEDMIYRSMYAGSSGTPTIKKLRFSMAPLTEGVRVMATLTYESTQLFGQVKSMTMNDKKTNAQIREALIAAGAL